MSEIIQYQKMHELWKAGDAELYNVPGCVHYLALYDNNVFVLVELEQHYRQVKPLTMRAMSQLVHQQSLVGTYRRVCQTMCHCLLYSMQTRCHVR